MLGEIFSKSVSICLSVTKFVLSILTKREGLCLRDFMCLLLQMVTFFRDDKFIFGKSPTVYIRVDRDLTKN